MTANSPIPAIANAIFDAVGVRVDSLPITPEKVLRGILAKQAAARDASLYRLRIPAMERTDAESAVADEAQGRHELRRVPQLGEERASEARAEDPGMRGYR